MAGSDGNQEENPHIQTENDCAAVRRKFRKVQKFGFMSVTRIRFHGLTGTNSIKNKQTKTRNRLPGVHLLVMKMAIYHANERKNKAGKTGTTMSLKQRRLHKHLQDL